MARQGPLECVFGDQRMGRCGPAFGERSGFTLIELLVVVAVIAILASLLMPTINRAMQHSSASRCSGHLRELTQGCMLYANQFQLVICMNFQHMDGTYSFFQQILHGFGKVVPKELPCPAESQMGPASWDQWQASWDRTGAPQFWYAYNRAYGIQELGRTSCSAGPGRSEMYLTTDVKRPGKVVYWADSCYYSPYTSRNCDPAYPEDRNSAVNRRLSFRHMNGLNLVYFDYHGEWMLGKDVRPAMWCPTKW